jgi:hypothetical protein
MDCTRPRVAQATAVRIGRLVENNLTNWATAAMRELALADHAGDDTAPLLTMGLAVLRARQDVRDGIRDVERQRWEARTR